MNQEPSELIGYTGDIVENDTAANFADALKGLGEFKIGDQLYGPGTMVFHQDPHFEEPLSTETGGLMLFVQYPGPTTGGRPIYDGRFNMKARKPVGEETVDV